MRSLLGSFTPSRCFQVATVILALSLAVPSLTHAQTFSVLYNFGANSGDPLGLSSPGLVAQGRDGNLYSTSYGGGAYGYGTVFRVTPAGEMTVLHSFDGNDGSVPYSGLILGRDGNFYGTTSSGGTFAAGTIFKITAKGKLTVLYSFTGGGDGANPMTPPVQGTDGNYYGTTPNAGGRYGRGTVFKMSAAGVLTTLYQFIRCCFPMAPLIQSMEGDFYGTQVPTDGRLFKITPGGRFSGFHRFTGSDGSNPIAPLMQASDGNFYGTTEAGGENGAGVIYRITLVRVLTVLHNFNGNTDGALPYAGLVEATDGNFYGATVTGGGPFAVGTLFSLSPQGEFSVLYDFDVTTGGQPVVTPLQHTNGLLYGTAQNGLYGGGVFYSLDVGLGPFVSLLSTSGKVGKTIQVLGQGFIGTTDVSFNGTPAAYVVVKDTFLKASVPVGATSGFLTVTSPTGTLKSNRQFRVKP